MMRKRCVLGVLLLTAAMLCLWMGAAGADSYLNWRYTDNGDGTATINGYSVASAELEVPAEINGLKVTTIGQSAFQGDKTLEKITIPEGVTAIETRAFSGASMRLTTVVLPQSLKTIGDYAFYSCFRMVDLSIPEGVTSIGAWAFAECGGIESFTIPQGITELNTGVFSTCDMTEIVIPHGVTSIGSSAFTSCSNLVKVVIPDSVTTIGDRAFASCYELQEVAMSKNVETIGNEAFMSNWALPQITLPASLTSLGEEAFNGCNKLTRVVFESGTDDTELEIGYRAFYSCEMLQDVTLPSSLRTLGRGAFEGCEGLTQIVLPEGLETVESSAFANCSALEDLYLPQSLQVLNSAFSGCSSLTNVYACDLPSWLRLTSNEDFSTPMAYAQNLYFGNELVREVVIPEGTTAIGQEAFCNCIHLEAVTLPSGLQEIRESAFKGCTGLTEMIIPEGVESLGASVFDGCTALETVTLPSTLRQSGSYAFRNCTALNAVYAADADCWLQINFDSQYSNPVYYTGELYAGGELLTEVEAAQGIAEITQYAFVNCDSLVSIVIPQGVNGIGLRAFEGCDALENVVLPSGLETINHYAFQNCASLSRINLPDTLTRLGDYVFSGCAALENIDLPQRLTYLGGSAFRECEKLASVALPGGITYLGSSPFAYCTSLAEASLSEGITSTGSSLFLGCTSLRQVALPSTLTEIGREAFRGCTSLEAIELPESIASLGYQAFRECKGLGSISLPGSITTLSTYVFQNCTGLTAVTFGEGIPLVSGSMFSGCSALNSVVLPQSIASIGSNAFNGCTNATFTVVADSYAHEWCQTNSKPFVLVGTAAEPFEFTWTENADGTLTITGYTGTRDIPSALPESIDGCQVTGIGDGAFADLDIGALELPDDIVFVGENAFHENLIPHCHYNTTTAATLHEAGISYGVLNNFTCRVDENGNAVITGYTHDNPEMRVQPELDGCPVVAIDAAAFAGNTLITSAIIPEGVTAIGAEAFMNCANLAGVSLPSTLVSIGDYAFCWCTELEEIAIPASVSEIGWAFFGTNAAITVEEGSASFAVADGVLYTKDLKQLVHCPGSRTGVLAIPEGTEVIGGRAFYACSGITEIRIPASVTDVSHTGSGGAFACMNSLERFVVDGANTAYQAVDGALLTKDGKALVSVPAARSGSYQAPEGVEAIHTFAFNGRNGEGISEVVLPQSVRTIEAQAFCNMALKCINLPESLEEIHAQAFDGCGDFLAVVEENSCAHQWCVDNQVRFTTSGFSYEAFGEGIAITGCFGTDQEIVIPASINGSRVLSISPYAFSGRTGLTAVELPSGLTTIGQGAFEGCTRLKAITLPSGLTSLGDYAFSGCTALTVVDDRGMAERVGAHAFDGCASLRQVTLGVGVRALGDYAFANCPGLDWVSMHINLTWIDDYSFRQSPNVILYVQKDSYPDLWAADEGFARLQFTAGEGTTCYVSACTRTSGSVEIPQTHAGRTVTGIGGNAFEGCTELEWVVIPECVTSIDATAFQSCSGLTVYGYTGSAAQTYAAENALAFIALDAQELGTYRIEFVNADGTVLQSSDFACGQVPIYMGETPTRAATPLYAYTFNGWTPEIVPVTGEATYTATYRLNQYTITFDTDGGSAIDPITAECGSEVKRPSAPKKTGYQFVCWLDENGNEALPPDIMPPYDTTFTAKWKAEHEHLLCGAADCAVSFHDPAHHVAGEFMPAPAADGKLTSGKYYLTKDISSQYWYGWNIPEGETVYLCLNGHKIEQMLKYDYHLMTVRGTLVLCDCTAEGMFTAGVNTYEVPVVVEGGQLIMYGGKITGMPAFRGVRIIENGSMTMYGGEISHNAGGGVQVNGGHLTIRGGAISGNTVETSSQYGGGAGVYVTNGTLTMQGGTISGNTALRADATSGLPGLPVGAGVYLTNGSTMTMSAGTISNNENSHGYGGGLMVGIDCHATISGGTISGNEGTYGTAIYAGADEESWNIPEGTEGGSVTITGGHISGGTDDDSLFGIQALYIGSIGSAEVTGGTITSGRYAISKLGSLTLGGNPSLEGAEADIAVSSGAITCGGRLSGDEGSITVAMSGTGLQYPHTLLRSCADYAVTEADMKVLRPVNADLAIRQNALGNAEIGRYTTITTQAVPEQAGVTSGDGSYFSGETAEISAVSNEGFAFVSWTDDKGNVMSETPEMSYLADGASGWQASLMLTANFALNQYEITAEANLPAAGSVSGAGTYNHGDPVTLTATAESGYAFAGWYENDLLVSQEETFTFTAAANQSFTASFVHVHSWQYEVQGSAIQASCTANGCEERDGGTVTISAPEGPLVYGDGREKTAAVAGALATGIASPTADDVLYSYKADADDDYEAIDATPENAGWYKASITVQPDDGEALTAYVEYQVARAEGPAAPAGLQTITPSAAGSSDGCITGVDPSMEYAGNTDFTNAQACSISTITGLKAGVYYVRVRETGNAGAGAAATVILHAANQMTLPAELTAIAQEAFAGLPVEELVLGGKVSSIGARAFADCKELLLIQLPDNVQIAHDAFDGCDQLTILCAEGSTGHAYAAEHGIACLLLAE